MFTVYNKIATMHTLKTPYWRIGQLMSNFNSWLQHEKGLDIFYLNNERFEDLLREFLFEETKA